MIALMTLWFGQYAGFSADNGYFYLCPACYHTCIAPHASEVIQRLVDSHPVRRNPPPRPTDPPPGAFS